MMDTYRTIKGIRYMRVPSASDSCLRCALYSRSRVGVPPTCLPAALGMERACTDDTAASDSLEPRYFIWILADTEVDI